MSAEATPTIEDRRDELIREGTTLRSNAVSLLTAAREFRVGLQNSLRRNPLLQLEKTSDQLLKKLVSYDDRMSKLLAQMATARQVITAQGKRYWDSLPYTDRRPPHGSTAPIDLNTQLKFAIYASGLSSQRETLRALLQEIGGTLNNHRSQANTLTAISIAVGSFLLALVGLFL